MTFGEWVRQQRESLPGRVSQTKFGNLLDRSKNYVSMLENDLNPSTDKPFNITPTLVLSVVNALRELGSNVTLYEAFQAASIPIPTQEEEMPLIQSIGGELPTGKHLRVEANDPIAEFTGEGLVWVVSPDDMPYRDQIKHPCIVVIRGERQVLRYMGEFAEGDQLIKKFKRNGDEFTVPSEDAVIESILHSRIDIKGLG